MAISIKHHFFYPHAVEIVWDYLTKSALIEQWLMENNFEPVVGHDFQFRTRPMPNFEFDGMIYCKVLEIVPFKKLSYSWQGGPGDGKITLDSIVVWSLHPKDRGTELLLEHSGFKEEALMMYTIMDAGWLKNIGKINELIAELQKGATDARRV